MHMSSTSSFSYQICPVLVPVLLMISRRLRLRELNRVLGVRVDLTVSRHHIRGHICRCQYPRRKHHLPFFPAWNLHLLIPGNYVKITTQIMYGILFIIFAFDDGVDQLSCICFYLGICRRKSFYKYLMRYVISYTKIM